VSGVTDDPQLFADWVAGLEARHLADLQFSEVSRALRALSSTYVERRSRLREGAALSGSGKRAAFALFYGPLHFLIVRHIVRGLGADRISVPAIVDCGCGTGAAGAAWGAACARAPQMLGIDLHPWALAEAAETYRHFGLTARTRRADIASAPLLPPPAACLAAFTLNELDDRTREQTLARLFERKSPVLIVEPLAKAVAPWWNKWRDACVKGGGRANEWRFRTELPAIVAKLDRAAGLDHREITARSMFLV